MDRLETILSGLAHLNLEGKIVRKQPYASALGASCDVYTAWSKRHKKKVAIKQIRVFLKTEKDLAKKLAKEIRIWSKLKHENVLPLLGYLIEGSNMMPSLISEWMEKGTLRESMKSFPRGGIETCEMLRDIAAGLAYLHSNNVIHADLKSQNILISPSGTPLLADFGLSFAFSQSQYTTETTSASTKGTVRWMAIELLPSTSGNAPKPSRHDEKTDIWSFGMVAYELLSWSLPYKDKSNDIQVLLAIVNGEVPEKPEPEPETSSDTFNLLWYLARLCWNNRNVSRPTAQVLFDRLSAEVFACMARVEDNKLSRKNALYQFPPSIQQGQSNEVSTAPHRSQPSFYSIWHVELFDCESPEGHTCHAQLIDDVLWFLCDPGFLITPISTVELRYSPRDSSSSRSLPYKFEFGVDSGSIENNSLASYRFAVLDEKEALAWVAAFEESWSLTVRMDGAPSDSTRPEPLGLSSSSISNRRDELDGVRKAREIQKRMRKDGGLEIHQTEDKSSWSPVFTRARKLLLGIRAKASQIFRVVN